MGQGSGWLARRAGGRRAGGWMWRQVDRRTGWLCATTGVAAARGGGGCRRAATSRSGGHVWQTRPAAVALFFCLYFIPITEAGRETTSIKATVNCDLGSEAVAKIASVNAFYSSSEFHIDLYSVDYVDCTIV